VHSPYGSPIHRLTYYFFTVVHVLVQGTSAREVESMTDSTTTTTAASAATANTSNSGVVSEPPLKITSYRGSATQCEVMQYNMRTLHTTTMLSQKLWYAHDWNAAVVHIASNTVQLHRDMQHTLSPHSQLQLLSCPNTLHLRFFYIHTNVTRHV
jgi:hypothetical protein